jgi:diaminopimelate decarboxylase
MKDSVLKSIAAQYNGPIYVYEGAKIQQQYTRLKNAFSGVENLCINYACKALSNISILNLMRSLGSGLDTVSIQEVQLGLKAGFRAEDIIFTPNGVSMEEIEQVATMGVQINIDNLPSLNNLAPNTPIFLSVSGLTPM